jgi:hypothetical protein
VEVNSFGISLGNVLLKLGEGTLDHLVYYACRKLSRVELNYTTIELEGLVMVYVLQKI